MSTAVGRRTFPAKTPVRKPDIVVPMLASDDERIRELASKRVVCAGVDADTDRVVWWVDVGVVSVVTGVVFEIDGGEQVFAVSGADLGLGEVKGTQTCSIGGGWRWLA